MGLVFLSLTLSHRMPLVMFFCFILLDAALKFNDECLLNYYSMAEQCYCQQNDDDIKRMLKCALCQRYFHLSMHYMEIKLSVIFLSAVISEFC